MQIYTDMHAVPCSRQYGKYLLGIHPTPSHARPAPERAVEKQGGAWTGWWGESLMGIFPYKVLNIGHLLSIHVYT